jgi:hypothetical protein
VARTEWGGAVVRGRRGCQGQSWKGRRGAPTRGGAQGGAGQVDGWLEEVALGGPGCGSQHRHGARKSRGGA